MCPRTKVAYQQIREDRQEQILAAARKVFASKGFSATAIKDIAAEAGISKGLIYHYFAGKDGVFESLVQRVMEGALALFRDALALPDTPWNRLHWLLTQVVIRAQQDPEEFMVIVQAYTSQAVPQKARTMAIQYTVASSQALRELIVEGQAAKHVITGDADQLAMTLTACLQGLALTAASPIHEVSGLPDVAMVLRMLEP
jgi:AcrR family transcriptional regulator